MARPLIEVMSMRYFPPGKIPESHLYSGGMIHVYGDVFLSDMDDPNQKYKLFDRSFEHPLSVCITEDSKQFNLLLPPPESHALSLSRPVLNVQLLAKGKSETETETSFNGHLIKGSVPLETAFDDSENSVAVCGAYGVVRVMYASLACALVARLRVRLNKDDFTNKCFIPAVGTITAYYVNPYGDKPFLPCSKMIVLDASPDEPTPIEWHSPSGVSLKLTRERVAVPAYSKLLIEADLRDRHTGKPVLQGTLFLWPIASTFASARCDNSPQIIQCQQASLYVSWFEPAVLQPSRRVDMSTCIPKYGWTYVGSLLEVYSVYIGRSNDAKLRIYGKIEVQYNCCRVLCPIYKRDCQNADELSEGQKLLSVSGPSKPSELFSCDDSFTILVDLIADAGKCISIADGSIEFDSDMIEEDELKFDQLLCSVIHGEGGYCAVHHTIFQDAVKLRVEGIVLCKNNPDGAGVYGRIVAWNGMFSYKIRYDKEYYRRVLFEKSEDDTDSLEKVTIESALDAYRFSTSYVAMPIGYPIFIDIDVYARSHSRKVGDEHFQQTLQFEHGDKLPMKITGDYFDILFYVTMIPISE